MLTNLEKACSMEKMAKKILAESNLYAPFSGIIGKKNIEMGMYAMPSISAITLLNTNNVAVKVSVSENIISSIKFEQKAKITISALDNIEFEYQADTKGIVSNIIMYDYAEEQRVRHHKTVYVAAMGVVICCGTWLSMLFVITVLLVAYWLVFKRLD